MLFHILGEMPAVTHGGHHIDIVYISSCSNRTSTRPNSKVQPDSSSSHERIPPGILSVCRGAFGGRQILWTVKMYDRICTLVILLGLMNIWYPRQGSTMSAGPARMTLNALYF